MKKLLSDEVVQLILDNIEGIGYTDILDMLDNEDIHFKEERELDKKKTIYSRMGAVIRPVYSANWLLVVEGIELPINFANKELGVSYDSNKSYLQKLVKQYQKFQKKIYIPADKIKQQLEEGYRVYYDGTDGVTVFNVTVESEFTVEDIFELKFYVIK